MSSDAPSDLARIGGPGALEALMRDFIGRVSQDFVIGFLFAGKDLERIIQMETALAAAHLGGPDPYPGRPIGATHRALRINRGQFRRRLAFLRRVLEEHQVPTDVAERWVDFNARLEGAVTDGTDCALEQP